MSTATNQIKNYFDAIGRFYTSWLKMFDALAPNNPDGIQAKQQAKDFVKMMEDLMNNLEKAALKQQREYENMTPQQYQQETLASFRKFEQAYDESTQWVKQQLSKQEEYIQSDQFIKDAEDSKTMADQMMNTMLEGFSNLINDYTDGLNTVTGDNPENID